MNISTRCLRQRHLYRHNFQLHWPRRFPQFSSLRRDAPAPQVAIVGSGPAGFYTAQKTMRELPRAQIDMYEQLPVPFGLVRFGVAPDHPEVKNCQESFEELASSPNYAFIGNIHLGHQLHLPLLARHYDAIVFAYGASQDRKLGLQGEDRPHIYSARAFVGWYNGLPEYRDLQPDLRAGETAVIIGQGNVALDVARTLLTPVDHLRSTDITDYALQALSESSIRHIHIVGRRGPLQAAFTIKEVRELFHLPDTNFTPIPNHLFPTNLSSLPRPKRRILDLLQRGTSHNPSATKSWSLDFLLAPNALEFSSSNPSLLEAVKFTRTKLSDPTSASSPVHPTDTIHNIPTSTLFRSIGYAAVPIPGMSSIGAHFDKRKGILHHDGFGRIIPLGTESQLEPHSLAAATNSQPPDPPPSSLYCSGWVKRGPTGVIASTMTDAFQTAEALVDDWSRIPTAHLPRRLGWEGVKADAAKQGIDLDGVVHWRDWHRIDAAEKRVGEEVGKPREKFGRVAEMLEASQRE